MDPFDALRGDYEDALAARDAALLRLEGARVLMQAQCPHPLLAVVQANHQSGLICDRPEFRVCRQCGYAEEGWGAGYWHLRQQDVPVLSQDVARGYVIGRIHTQEDLAKVRDLARNGPKPGDNV